MGFRLSEPKDLSTTCCVNPTLSGIRQVESLSREEELTFII